MTNLRVCSLLFFALLVFSPLALAEDDFLEALKKDKAATQKPTPVPAGPAPVMVPARQVVPDATTGVKDSMSTTKTTPSADAEIQFKQADAELNAVYKDLKRILRSADQTELMKAQRTWVASKEEVVKTIGSEDAKASFLTRVTRDRTEQLRRLMKTISEPNPAAIAQKASQPKLVRPDATTLTPGDILEGPWRALDANGGVTFMGPPYFSKLRIFATTGYISGQFTAVRYTGRNGMYFMCVPLN